MVDRCDKFLPSSFCISTGLWKNALYKCGYTMITMTHGRKNPVHSRYLVVTFLRGAPGSSYRSPTRAGYGRPLWIQILPRGRFMLNILLQSSATYRESIVVRSQHNSRVAIWNQCQFLPGKKNYVLLDQILTRLFMRVNKMVVPSQTTYIYSYIMREFPSYHVL